MPSDLPRVTAYVSPETREALDAAAEAMGRSRSRMVGDLLEASVPVLRAMTDAALVVRNAGQMQRAALAATAEDMAAVTATAEGLRGQVLGLIGRVSAEDPRPSNTGVRK